MFNRTSLHIAMLVWGAIFSLIATLCMFMSKNFDKNKRVGLLSIQTSCAVLLFCDALAWGFRGYPGEIGYFGVRISNFLVFIISDIILFLYTGYMCCCIFRKHDKLPKMRLIFVGGIVFVGVLLVIISQFTNLYYYIDAHNYYHRNPAHIISMLLPMVGMLLDFSIVIQYRTSISRLTFVALLSYMALPFCAVIVQIFYYGISLTNIAISISMILMFVVAVMEQNENVARQERDAADLRISIMISQIAPHFIYNALTTIRELCSTDPQLASETVNDFAEYLRGNLESLNNKTPVPFRRELDHVNYYVAIEKKRFADRVNVRYDIEEEDFVIPSLTLQPIVENAIKHGLCKKKGGGTIRIITERKRNMVYVMVEDDGVGFDQNAGFQDGEEHVGLRNVEMRVKTMCGGRLLIDSKVGRGTKVMIELPQ